MLYYSRREHLYLYRHCRHRERNKGKPAILNPAASENQLPDAPVASLATCILLIPSCDFKLRRRFLEPATEPGQALGSSSNPLSRLLAAEPGCVLLGGLQGTRRPTMAVQACFTESCTRRATAFTALLTYIVSRHMYSRRVFVQALFSVNCC